MEAALLAQLGGMPPDDPHRAAVRSELVTLHLPLVRYIARRFRGRGEQLEDLMQVGAEGLLKAIERYDPDRSTGLAPYAAPTIAGEIRRHLRDRTGAVHVPRRIAERQSTVAHRIAALTAEYGRAPTVAEVAAACCLTVEAVQEVERTRRAMVAEPIDALVEARRDPAAEEPGFARVDDRETVRLLLSHLTPLQQHLLELRFGRGMTQSQIATAVGMSQMQVSRLLRRILTALRETIVEE